ncbi:TrbI/VirB10 family protein [Magnetospira sp. QH-2]|uniref:TrbI/VirB10 family protein n=1 Tax=Magnetospira sp. (strain QH-2) TaxID=1288970 RepID=UPI0003E81625|nr:TrbI/VirB10 family protein [Magnetospira sp. QH-2]CCQ75754.1 Protein of unknown function [Magnetospira sp. QH-2]
MAGIVCELLAAVGLAVAACEDQGPAVPPPFPDSDQGVFEFKAPAPPPLPQPKPGRLQFVPPLFDYGRVLPGNNGGSTLNVVNEGGEAVRIGAVVLGVEQGGGKGEFQLDGRDCEGRTLAPGQGCAVTVDFDVFKKATPGDMVARIVATTGKGDTVSANLEVLVGKKPRIARPAPPPPPKPKAWPKPIRDEGREAAARILAERRAGAWDVGQPPLPSATALPPVIPAQSKSSTDYMDKGYSMTSVDSSLPVDQGRVVSTVRYIHGIVETGINSQVAGEQGGKLIIQVSKDVYSPEHDNLLIPKGSRLDCQYDSLEKQGDSRLPVVCKRVLRAEDYAELFEIAAPAGDTMGRAGVPGEVDNRIWERYGTAFIVSALSVAATVATEHFSQLSPGLAAGGSKLSDDFGEITAKILEQSVNLAPIITIAQGTRVVIMPRNDWVLRNPGTRRVAKK